MRSERRDRVRAAAWHAVDGTAALGLVAACLMAPSAVRATTVEVTGGGGLDVGEICSTSDTCPSASPVYNLSTDAGLGGSFVFTSTGSSTGTVSFNLSLSSPATFTASSGSTNPSSIQLGALSTFSGTVSVATSADGAGIKVVETGLAFGTSSMNFSSGFSPSGPSTPVISSLTCTIGTGSDICGVTVGGTDLELTNGTSTYQAQITFDTNVMPVPLSASLWFMLGGLGVLGFAHQKRRPSVR